MLLSKNINMPNKQNAKYAFYYLLSLVALVFMALGTGMILFSIIDKTVPDALNFTSGNFDGPLKFAISALLIATPVYYAIFSLIGRGLRRGEIDKDSGIRRWLTYFHLLVSALIILGVFIGVINTFLSGSLTSQFILKALVVFFIATAVFAFYLYDIRRQDFSRKILADRIFFWLSLLAVVAVFVAAWFFVESPQVARERRLDQILANNIYSLESAVNSYYDRYKKLPDGLEAIAAEKDIYLPATSLVDPETKTAIIYQKLGEKDFQFCATFRTDSAASQPNAPVSYPRSANNHGAGYQCLKGNLYNVVPVKAL